MFYADQGIVVIDQSIVFGRAVRIVDGSSDAMVLVRNLIAELSTTSVPLLNREVDTIPIPLGCSDTVPVGKDGLPCGSDVGHCTDVMYGILCERCAKSWSQRCFTFSTSLSYEMVFVSLSFVSLQIH